MWLYYSRFLFWWEEGVGIERTPEPGILPGLRLRRGPAKNQLLSCRGRPGSIPGSGCEVQDGRVRVAAREFDLKCEVEWVHGSWMSRQRCAGRRGGKAEFPCGLMGRGWAEALRCRLGVCRGVSLSAGSVSNCGGIFGWVLCDFFSGAWYGWYIL